MAQRTRRPRTTAPPNKVDPGWVHEGLANTSLRFFRSIAERNSVHLNVGKLQELDELVPESANEPEVLLARLYAHIGHRIPLMKRAEKRLEGKELKAGVASDLIALIVQFYTRNKEVLPIIGQLIQVKLNEAKAKAEAAKTADSDNVTPLHNQEGMANAS